MTTGSIVVSFIAIIGIILVLILFLRFVPLGLWISARAAGVRVRIVSLIAMRFRRVNPFKVVLPMIKATKAGLDLDMNELEAHLLAGGSVDRVVDSLIAAQSAQIPLEFEQSRAIDLAGRDVLEAVKMSVNPKVIETPVVAAIAKDGIELRAKARVTVRANIARLVGGAGEETIIARVGEGIRHHGRLFAHAQGKCWKTRISSAARCWPRVWTRARPLRSSPSTSPTWTWAVTWARSCRSTRQRPTAASRRPRPRSAAPWPWPTSRK